MVLHHDSATVRPQGVAMCTDFFPHGTVITIKYSANEHIDYCDHAHYRSSDLKHFGNLVAAIFRLENASSKEDIVCVLDDLILWLKKPQQEHIRRTFTVWIKRVLLPTKSVTAHIQEINDLTEIRTMLAQTVSKITEEWVLQGRNEGKIEGKIEGEKILLLRLIRHRFGENVAFQAQSIIDSVRSLTTLEIIGDWVVDAANGDDLLEKLRTMDLSKNKLPD